MYVHPTRSDISNHVHTEIFFFNFSNYHFQFIYRSVSKKEYTPAMSHNKLHLLPALHRLLPIGEAPPQGGGGGPCSLAP